MNQSINQDLFVKKQRRSFGTLVEKSDIPDLIRIQKESYEQFLQFDVRSDKRKKQGLEEVLQEIFPIEDSSGRAHLEYVKYHFDEPKYDVDECQERGLTFSSALRVTLRLIVWDIDENDDSEITRDVREQKEQEVYMGDIPLMTRNGTFIINGTERVIVSQMHRSPGVFFDHDRGKGHSSGKLLFAARVIPNRGSWLDFEFDAKDVLNVRIDRRRKILATTLLKALPKDILDETKEVLDGSVDLSNLRPGTLDEDILREFYDFIPLSKKGKDWIADYEPDHFKGVRLAFDLVNAETKEVVAPAKKRVSAAMAKKFARDGLKKRVVSTEELHGCFAASDIFDENTGEIFVGAGDELTDDVLNALSEQKIKKLDILFIDNVNVGPYIRNTLVLDKNSNREEALLDIYRIMRPGEPPTIEAALDLFCSLFFDSEKYDLSTVGRVKLNTRLDLKCDDQVRVLRYEDIIAIVKQLLLLKDGHDDVDDIDHLGNRRVRSVGELLQNQIRIGCLRLEKTIRERMIATDLATAMPNDLLNSKAIATALKEFFGTSQLSQFMDQTNPLAEITHKRRVSALGPGGLSRERAGFEVRDVHPTHYGRICPIETPEGPNIGLINSLATHAVVNKYGFIESPYHPVKGGMVQDGVVYLTAMEEGRYKIAQANAPRNKKGEFEEEFVPCRFKGDLIRVPSQEVDFIDVSPKQVVSVAASLIPFLENDDANRALMGSNMQRQAVPLLKSQAPVIGTGMEDKVARDSGTMVTAKHGGTVEKIDARRIIVKAVNDQGEPEGVDIYNLSKYKRSNQNTCMNQRPTVQLGEKIKAGDVIADGSATSQGELALGKNVLCAFMPWNGYNYEDSILISQRLVKEDEFTSIHIEEFEVVARDTKLGHEDVTRDIPNVGEDALRNLDESGIAYVGAEVKPGDILVGKVTPKGESPATPEEKLLRAIFGEKASDVRDTSLRLPSGANGTVIDVKIFSRRGIEKDERSLAIDQEMIYELEQERDAEKQIIFNDYRDRVIAFVDGHQLTTATKSLKEKTVLSVDVLADLGTTELSKITVADEKVMDRLEVMKKDFNQVIKNIESRFKNKVEKIQKGDDLPPGILKMVKVAVAVKRRLQPGDKMAGRHGNKGVISRIVPVEDMPFMEDGTPVDIVLNPLGVPSRMNVGQILETHLGWASVNLGKQISKTYEQYRRAGQKKDAATQKDALKSLRTQIDAAYQDKQYATQFKKLSDDGILTTAKHLAKGVPMATPVFDGPNEDQIIQYLDDAGVNISGQSVVYDGRTGQKFDRNVTVGYIYMMKLDHLADAKIHARSIGPYSLVTQQPLGGKAQFGGQRLGEMEVWALEAYGAAYTLQEMLTIKSDDVAGRTKVYESIVRGDQNFEVGIPESFNVLVKELQSLGLNVQLLREE